MAARAEALDAARGLETKALILTVPFLPFDSVEASRLRAALATAPAARESFFLPDPDDVRPALRYYLRGILSAQLGDSAAAIRLAADLGRLRVRGQDESLGVDLARGVRAEIARLGGRPQEALGILEEIADRSRYQLVLPSPFEARVR
jgi:hypothetical protein